MNNFLVKLKTKKKKLPVSLRSYRDELHYHHAKKMGLTKPLQMEKMLKEWQYWALIDNKFPYSAAFKTHHMLIPKRVATK